MAKLIQWFSHWNLFTNPVSEIFRGKYQTAWMFPTFQACIRSTLTREVCMSPANFRRWRRILIWSTLTGGTVWFLGLMSAWNPKILASLYSIIGLWPFKTTSPFSCMLTGSWSQLECKPAARMLGWLLKLMAQLLASIPFLIFRLRSTEVRRKR